MDYAQPAHRGRQVPRHARSQCLGAFVVLLAVCAMPASAAAGQAPADRLKTLTLDELMDVDVTSVSRRSEPVADAAAAVDVITGDELRRSGATSLAEALRLLSGVFAARSDGHTWSISARGFAAPTSNKLLVLIDGRSVYTPLFSGVFWDVQDVVLADVERIEVIRGPGATLWGANAVNGVINVITKPASRTPGGTIELGAGTNERALGTVRYGDQIGALSYRLFGKYDYLDENRAGSTDPAHDAFRRGLAGGRADWTLSPRSQLSVTGSGYRVAAGLFDRPDSTAYGWNLLGRWNWQLASSSDLQVQAYYDRSARRVPWQFRETRNTWDFDIQYRARPHPRHTWLVGGGYRLTSDTTGVPDAATAPSTVLFARFDPASRASPLYAGYVQDEFEAVSNRLYLTAGARFEHNDYTGGEVQPTIRLRWRVQSKASVWAAVSRAVRTPSRLDADVRFERPDGTVLIAGAPAFEAERVIAYEVGYRVQALPSLLVDVAGYHNRYDRLRSLEPGASRAPLVLGNGVRGHTSGLETTVDYRPSAWMRWRASWTLFDKQLALKPGSADRTVGAGEGNDPGQTLGLRATINLPRDVELDGFLRAIASLPAPRVPGYAELDVRAGWWMSPDWELTVAARNLLHDWHPEFGPAGGRQIEFPRNVTIRLTTFF